MVSKAGVAELTAYEVVKYWVRAPIKTVSMPTVKTRIIKLLEEHDSLLRNMSRQSVTDQETYPLGKPILELDIVHQTSLVDLLVATHFFCGIQ